MDIDIQEDMKEIIKHFRAKRKMLQAKRKLLQVQNKMLRKELDKLLSQKNNRTKKSS